MANKTSKEIDKHVENTYRFRWEGLRRRPEFIEAVKKYHQSLKNNPTRYFKLETEFIENWGIFVPPENYLNDPERWYVLDFYDIAAVVPDRKWIKTIRGKTYQQKFMNWQTLLEKNKVELYKHILKNDRFLTLRIDTDRDKTIIMRAISKKLDWIIGSKKKFELGEALDKTPHLNKSDRYFKVYDLRNKRPPMKYKDIALKLLKDYTGRNKSLERIINNCKNDFRVAFEEIHNTPYKEYDKNKLEEVNLKKCYNCEARGKCSELCPEVEYYLSKVVEKRRSEGLFNKNTTDPVYSEDIKSRGSKLKESPLFSKVDYDTEKWLNGKLFKD